MCGTGQFRAADMAVGRCQRVKNVCGKGTEQMQAPTTSTDRECRDCPGGKFKLYDPVDLRSLYACAIVVVHTSTAPYDS